MAIGSRASPRLLTRGTPRLFATLPLLRVATEIVDARGRGRGHRRRPRASTPWAAGGFVMTQQAGNVLVLPPLPTIAISSLAKASAREATIKSGIQGPDRAAWAWMLVGRIVKQLDSLQGVVQQPIMPLLPAEICSDSLTITKPVMLYL